MTMTTSHSNNGPQVVATVNEAPKKAQSTPIWLAALVAARCSADDGSEGHCVSWSCISGRAVYTNGGAGAERIEPLGVNLETGQTLAVCWMPGETTYTVEVYWQRAMASVA
jgi:hypothetical protein